MSASHQVVKHVSDEALDRIALQDPAVRAGRDAHGARLRQKHRDELRLQTLEALRTQSREHWQEQADAMAKLRATPTEWQELERIERILEAAYLIRPCFHCGKREKCPFREPEIEVAIAEQYGIGAETCHL